MTTLSHDGSKPNNQSTHSYMRKLPKAHDTVILTEHIRINVIQYEAWGLFTAESGAHTDTVIHAHTEDSAN